ncbi:hypothetical protein RI367_003903 [Sorochytrium milnesiophthora]
MGIWSWLRGGSSSTSSSTDAATTPVVALDANTFSGDLETVPRKVSTCYHLEGFLSCEYFRNAMALSSRVTGKADAVHVDVNATSKDVFVNKRIQTLQQQIKGGKGHTTCPFIYEGCEPKDYKYVGGYDDFAALVKKRHGVDA